MWYNMFTTTKKEVIACDFGTINYCPICQIYNLKDNGENWSWY